MAFIALETSGNGLYTITLTANKKPFTFVIDTGSNISHLDCAAATKLGKGGDTKNKATPVTGISGDLESFGKVQQTFTCGIFTFDFDFEVTDLSKLFQAVKADGGPEICGILGTDFLTKYKCHIDFKKNRLHLG